MSMTYYDPHGGAPYPTPYGNGGYSDKSKVTAGLLQLIPGFCLEIGGIGRLYAGHTALGVVQLVVSFLGWIAFFCGFAFFLPFFFFAAAWIWFVIDGIVLLAGNPRDGRGLPMRD